MPDDADELILKMQHLEAQARAQQDARAKQSGAGRVKTAAQQLAFEARLQLEEAEAAQRLAEDKQDRARTAGLPPLEAAELLEWEALQAEARAETHARLADDPLFKKP